MVLPGAIYVSGGVANYLARYFKDKEAIFFQHFLAHNQMRHEVLEKV
jgi:hypothetical protein